LGKRRRASHRFSPPFLYFFLNLEDEILFKGGRICNTHFVNLLERIPIEKTISPYVGLTCVHHPM
jgi:hypothetical protein